MIEPEIREIPNRQFVGMSLKMSLSANQTRELWRSFISRRAEIQHAVSNDLVSLQTYDPMHFIQFDPAREFEKWALAEVSSLSDIPEGMKPFLLPCGKYAVFSYKGKSGDSSIFHFIFSQWLPSSDYELDGRPHFEVLGSKYRNNDPESEEDIWIPVKLKPGQC
jgi:AraC family transcriptional regulator